MDRLKTMQNKVEWVLTKYPAHFYNVNVGCETFKEVLLNDKLPNFETIRRCRQKAQADNPELRGKKDKERLDRQAEYVAYATEG